MISAGPATRVFLALGVTDMRKGYSGAEGGWEAAPPSFRKRQSTAVLQNLAEYR